MTTSEWMITSQQKNENSSHITQATILKDNNDWYVTYCKQKYPVSKDSFSLSDNIVYYFDKKHNKWVAIVGMNIPDTENYRAVYLPFRPKLGVEGFIKNGQFTVTKVKHFISTKSTII